MWGGWSWWFGWLSWKREKGKVEKQERHILSLGGRLLLYSYEGFSSIVAKRLEIIFLKWLALLSGFWPFELNGQMVGSSAQVQGG